MGVLSTRLLEKLNNKLNGQAVPAAELLALQIARDDIRNYVVLGDPAVRLKPEQDHVSGKYRHTQPALYEPCHKMRMPFSAFYAAGGEQ